jgi:hypothetical protein
MPTALTELVAARGDIDTSDQFDMCEAYQKIFIANGVKLKVADFANTKLTVTALTNPPAKGDILTQAQGGSNYAFMVVDFVDRTKTHIYGSVSYSGGTTAFNTSNTFSSNNATATMSPATKTPSAVTASPHWYDWTTYPDVVLSLPKFGQETGATKSFGSLPDKAYIICLYRGRLVLSGDPGHANQWYMSRQADPWDFAYCANDAGSPVAGGDADAGEIGDIVRALIPYKDDFIIHGCASSLWTLSGDPAEGGSLNQFCLTAGMLGAKAFAWDSNNNLYILATTGILKIGPNFAPPQSLTELSYPNFIKDLAFNPALHRLTMGYDKQRDGIVICKTTLATGANTCWWYDMKAEGLFPESYPEECGPYSIFYYDSNNPDDTGLLIGCTDGYIRVFDDTKKDDDIGPTDELIDSNVTLGPVSLAAENKEGIFDNMSIESVGGDTGGSETDSDNIDYEIFTARTADAITEKMIANTAPVASGTIVAPGRPRGSFIKKRLRVYGLALD